MARLTPASSKSSGKSKPSMDAAASSAEHKPWRRPQMKSKAAGKKKAAQAAHKKPKSGGFESMGLCEEVYRGVRHKGYRVPTPIQRKAMPLILAGLDVAAMARTGSGKTAAFLVPMLQRLRRRDAGAGIRALILSPTRELATQTLKFTHQLGKFTDLKAELIVGGGSIEGQFDALSAGPDIVIATPGRFVHLLTEAGDDMSLRSVEYVVFDEADSLFSMGFAEQLHKIIHKLSDTRQTLLFSATMPKALAEFAKADLRDPQVLRLDLDKKISPDLKLVFFTLRQEEKLAALLYLVRERISSEEQTMIFVSTKYHVEFLNILFREEGLEASLSYGAMDQEARNIHIARFRARKTMLLIVTDVAARGLDIPLLDNVVNWDFPAKPKLFVHRVGRVARQGRIGTAYTFVTSEDMPFLLDLHLFLSKPLRPAPTEEELLKDMDGMNSKIDESLANGETVYGRFPQTVIDLVSDGVKEVINGCTDLIALEKPCANAFRLYLKTRAMPSKESIKRAKDLPREGLHPIFRDVLGSAEILALAFSERLKLFRPKQTILEAEGEAAKSRSSKGSNQWLDVMKKKREVHEGIINLVHEKNSDDLATKEQEAETFSSWERKEICGKKRKSHGFRDEDHYISSVPQNQHSEAGLSVKGDEGFVQNRLDAAVLDLVDDETSGMQAQKTRYHWMKNKFVKLNSGDRVTASGKIKTESSAKSKATSTGIYKKWQKKSHRSINSGGKIGDFADGGTSMPAGERVPVARVVREAAETYALDRRARAQEALLPFRHLCDGRANLFTSEAVVVEGDSVAEALLRYAAETGVRSLVLGSGSFQWFQRVLSIPDVPSAVLQAAQNSCNVFVVCKRRLIVKVAGDPPTSNYSTSLRTHSVSHREFAETQESLLFDNYPEAETHSVSCSLACNSHSASVDASSSLDSHGEVVIGNAGANASLLKEVPSAVSTSNEEYQSIDEVEKLRKELKETTVMYDKACEDLVHAKKKIQVLSSKRSEEARKMEHALHLEENLRRVAANEKAKHLEAIKEVEKAKRSFTREAYSKHKAEMVGSIIYLDKEKVVDAILSTTKSCRRYSKHQIEVATDNFSEARKIGEGGYGTVYRCTLDHIEVAVKVIQQDSTDKTDDFLREVEILSKLQHPNLVLLIGFCPEIGCLVYEYLENGSLEDQLFTDKWHQPLHWFLRFRIIFEVSCGLAFLHGRKPEPIVHRDLKPANILLNKNYVGKIGDAGFAKLVSDVVPDWQTEYTDTIVAGTLYYMDPEYQQTGTVRPKSDLFALGVIILQVLTGKRPNGLILRTENAIKSMSLSHILDKSQTNWPLVEAEMLAKLGLQCTALKCRDRPDLEMDVLPKLEEILHRISSDVNLKNPKSSVPSHFICPITHAVMNEPYVAADGHTYEHHAIKSWIRTNRVSPVTRCKLPNSSIIPNHSLHAAIQQWKKSQSTRIVA